MKGEMNRDLAIFLGYCCKLTYDQLKNNNSFFIPAGYNLIKSFKASAMGRREWFGFVLASQYHAIIAFRGSVLEQDWISDADVSQIKFPYLPWAGQTHKGFTAIYSSCRDEIMEVIRGFDPDMGIYITGHSLGAALAALCAFDTAANLGFKNLVMYNFASPRAGSPEFAANYDALVKDSMRIFNTHDAVPKVPLEKMYWPFDKKHYSYAHISKAYEISFQTKNIHGNHDIDNYIKALYGIKQGS